MSEEQNSDPCVMYLTSDELETCMTESGLHLHTRGELWQAEGEASYADIQEMLDFAKKNLDSLELLAFVNQFTAPLHIPLKLVKRATLTEH